MHGFPRNPCTILTQPNQSINSPIYDLLDVIMCSVSFTALQQPNTRLIQYERVPHAFNSSVTIAQYISRPTCLCTILNFGIPYGTILSDTASVSYDNYGIPYGTFGIPYHTMYYTAAIAQYTIALCCDCVPHAFNSAAIAQYTACQTQLCTTYTIVHLNNSPLHDLSWSCTAYILLAVIATNMICCLQSCTIITLLRQQLKYTICLTLSCTVNSTGFHSIMSPIFVSVGNIQSRSVETW